MISIVQKIEEANCITHSGTMHADEVFATAFLDLYLKDVKVYRTNAVDFSKVSFNALVYDIGRDKFDHHQSDALKRDNGITYCSFGLLWKEFGRDFLKKYGIENVEEVFLGIDKDLIEGIDADDNGVFPKIEADFKVKTLTSVIKLFNPSYDSSENESDQFLKAALFAEEILKEEILYIKGKVIADKKVEEIIKNNNNKNYLILEEFIPYEESLLNLEEAKEILFVAFPSNRGGYSIKTVPKSIDDRTARLDFPLEWGGKSQEELEKISNIDGLTFCHTARFIVACKDLDAVHAVLEKMCKVDD